MVAVGVAAKIGLGARVWCLFSWCPFVVRSLLGINQFWGSFVEGFDTSFVGTHESQDACVGLVLLFKNVSLNFITPCWCDTVNLCRKGSNLLTDAQQVILLQSCPCWNMREITLLFVVLLLHRGALQQNAPRYYAQQVGRRSSSRRSVLHFWLACCLLLNNKLRSSAINMSWEQLITTKHEEFVMAVRGSMGARSNSSSSK